MSPSSSKTYAFSFQPGFRLIALLIMGLMGLLLLILVPVMIISPPKGRVWPVILILFGSMGPFWGFGWYFFSRHSGRILVNDETISLERFGRTRSLRLDAVDDVVEWDWNIPPGFVLRAGGEKLSFSRMIVGLPHLYDFLSSRIAVLSLENVRPPLRFMGRRRYFREYSLILALIAVVIGIPFGMALPNQKDMVEAILMYFFIVSIMAGLGVLAALPGRRTPADIVLEKDRIALRNLYGTQVFLKPDDILDVSIKAIARRASADGVSMTAVDHVLCITVRDEEQPWKVDSRAARHLRTTPERLAAVLRHVYDKGPAGSNA